nr:hexokinase-3 [Quercus suber]
MICSMMKLAMDTPIAFLEWNCFCRLSELLRGDKDPDVPIQGWTDRPNETKPLSISYEVGREVSECLEQAMARKGLNMQVAALVQMPVIRSGQMLSLGVKGFLQLLEAWTPLMAEIHEDDSPELTEVARILKDTLEIPDVPLKVRKLVVKVCDVVTRRAARLAAAGIVGILKKIGQDGSGGITGGRSRSDIKMKRTVVAIEGGLFTSYTMFREYLHEAMIEILGEEAAQHVILMVTEDRAGVGAALLAATHSSDRVDNVQLL